MIVILEGPDGAGKTHLANQLVQRLGLQYHHEGPPPKNISALEYYGAVLDQYRGKHVVFDRFALGERVYGHLHRGFDGLGADGWRVLKRLIRAMNGVEILCLPSYETCRNAWASGREEMVKDERIFAKVYERYYELRGDQFIYDYTQPGHLEGMIRIIKKFDEQQALRPRMVGSPKATYLFVGDQGSNKQARHDLPFFATIGSSAFLNRAIADAGYDEEEIAFINAYQHNGTVNQIPWFPVIIALGLRAQLQCERQGLQFHQVSHPQYFKRFRASEYPVYVQQLRQCKQ